MHSIANGSSAAVGLVGSAPPVTETSADSPDFLVLPAQPVSTFMETPEPPAVTDVADVEAGTARRLVIRLLGGEEVELGDFDDRDDAVEAAQALVARFNSAEQSGEWPEVEGRFLRPAAIASVDVLARD
jgi:hypothetical protein